MFISEAVRSVLRLDLLAESVPRWIGEIGCELLIEVLLAATGAGTAAVAARISERVIDFIQARQRGIDGDNNNGDNNDPDNDNDLPGQCVLRSFSADTEVLLANGTTLAISEVEVGDLVWAHDPQSGEAGARAVTAIWPHEDTLVEFEVGSATVTTTEDHEFWNVTDQAWQETQHIDPGDNLLTADGHVVEAGNLLWDTAHHAPAFDLTVDEIHAYHVTAGDEHVLVHNNGSTCGVVVTESSLRHVVDTHKRDGPDFAEGESFFLDELSDLDIEFLISESSVVTAVEQANGRFSRVFRNTDPDIGQDGVVGIGRAGLETDLIEVITEADGTLVTAFPVD